MGIVFVLIYPPPIDGKLNGQHNKFSSTGSTFRRKMPRISSYRNESECGGGVLRMGRVH
jgi:hypothetical protein